MRVIPILLLTAALFCGGAVFALEHLTVRRAERLVETGDAAQAMALYSELIAARPIFLNTPTLAIGRETVAYRALRGAVDEHQFARASDLATIILEGPESGLKHDTRAIAADLSRRHLQWAAARLEAGDAEEAVRQSVVMRAIYASDPLFVERVRSFEASSRLALSDHMLEQGDTRRVLVVLSALDADAPLPVRRMAEARVREAVVRPSNFYADRRDFPALLRWLQEARHVVGSHAYLASQVEQAYLEYIRTLLEIPVPPHPMPERFDDTLPSMVTKVASDSADATLLVENGTGRHLTVHLRGPEDRKTVIPPGGSWKIEVSPGEYVQAAQVGPDTRPYIGIVKIGGHNAYGQRFVIGGNDKSRHLSGATLALRV